MTGLLQHLRDGDWLTLSRVRLFGYAVLIASAASVLFLVATSDGLVDYQGRPLGTDFSNVYAAGTYALEGRPDAPLDMDLQLEREKEIFGPLTPLYSWHYPPIFLLVAAPLALIPYTPALAVWQGVTLLFYLVAIGAIIKSFAGRLGGIEVPRALWLVLAIGFPAVMVNLGHGNNGFMTTALLAGGLVLLERQPVAAGILLGLLAYKPQFGMLLPLVLLASGRWRTIIAATVTVIALVLVTTAFFGIDAWRAFFAAADMTRRVVLEEGGPGFHKMQSVFAWTRMWGGSVALAYVLQGVTMALIAAALAWLWHGAAAYPLKAAALCVGVILMTPYSLDYDLMLAAPAVAWLALDGLSRGFAPYEKTAIAALWLVPLIARTFAQWTLIPLGVIALVAVLILTVRRAASDLGYLRHAAPIRS